MTLSSPRRFTDKELIIASHNAGKIREIRELLVPFGIDVTSAADLGLEDPEETGATFVANAELKARASALATQKPALADDSGLCVAALNGDPGIFSARWGGPSRDFNLAMDKVREGVETAAAEGRDDRSAYFICVLSLCWPDSHCESFEGRIDGRLVFPPRGDRGFGYDPIFIANGETLTFGEMDPDKKHAMSHRAKAFAQLIEACFR